MIALRFKHNTFGINQILTSNYITEIHIWEFHAVVTQLGECKTEDLEVAGSSPAHGTINYYNPTCDTYSSAALFVIQVY